MSSSRISTNAGFSINDFFQPKNAPQTAPAQSKSAAETNISAAQSQTNLTETLASRSGVNSAANQRFALHNRFAARQTDQINRKPSFQTVGGEWGRNKETGKVEFYRNGFDPNKVEKFDKEFYLPDSQKYPLAANGKYVRLNAKGDLNSLPEFAGKPKPADISTFDWQGFEWVDAKEVPAQHITGDGKIAFENPALANNQLNALKRFVLDNNLVKTWDEAKFQQVFGATAGTSIKLELEPVGEENGKTVFNATMSDESLKELRAGLQEYRAAVAADVQGGIKGQQEESRMGIDIPIAAYETVRKTAEGALNAVQDTMNTVLFPPFSQRTGSEPNFGRAKVGEMYDQLSAQPPQYKFGEGPIPRIKTDVIKLEFQSEAMRRGVFTGKVDDGVSVGDAATSAASIVAPIAVAKVLTPVKAPQTLESVGALPRHQPVTNSNVFRNTSSGTAPFDPVKLQKIQANLEKRGVAFVTGEEGERLAAFYGAEALYIPDYGRPGIIVLGKNPSTAAVVEELIHLGQHRRLGWGDISGQVPKMEVEAQQKLLKLGEKLDWSQEEMDRIKRAMEVWRKQQ